MKSPAILITIFSSLVILCAASQCSEDSLSNEESRSCNDGLIPTWVDGIISSMEQNGNSGEVIQFRYHLQTVFWINYCAGCPDSITQVYDCQQNEICTFGGIAGFNTCPDFDQKATHKKIIWKN